MKILATEHQQEDILHDYIDISFNYIKLYQIMFGYGKINSFAIPCYSHSFCWRHSFICSPLNHLQIHNFNFGCIKKIKEAVTFSKAKNICDIFVDFLLNFFWFSFLKVFSFFFFISFFKKKFVHFSHFLHIFCLFWGLLNLCDIIKWQVFIVSKRMMVTSSLLRS